MGSSESSSGAEKYGEWRNAYEKEKCEHDRSCKNVKTIRWKSVPITGGEGVVGITILRVLSLGTSEIAYQGQSYNHDCVEAYVKCEKCGKDCYYTLEYSSKGREMYRDRYEKYVPKDGVSNYNPKNMTLKDLDKVHDNVWYNIRL